MLDLRNLSATSKFVGFQNYKTFTNTITLPAVTLPASTDTTIVTTLPIDNNDATSRIRVNYQTVDATNWYQIEGSFSTRSSGVTSTYDLFTFVNYTGTDMSVIVNEINLSGGSLSIPQQTINISVRLFLAPF